MGYHNTIGGLQVGGGINLENAMSYLNEGASHVIVTSVRVHDLICVNNTIIFFFSHLMKPLDLCLLNVFMCISLWSKMRTWPTSCFCFLSKSCLYIC